MTLELASRRRRWGLAVGAALMAAATTMPAQQMVTETRDPAQPQDEEFARLVKEWTPQAYFMSPLVDHLPKVKGVPTPKDVLGYYIGAPRTLTYYSDILKYYRALAAATPRVRVESIGKSDENRELVVVWVSSDENMKNLQKNRDNLAKIADPRGLSPEQIKQLIATTKPHYHLMGGLHSGETGPSEMLMELVYRLATETSPLITQIRNNVIVSVTPVADADGRDRNVDWFYRGLETAAADESARGASGGGRGRGAGGAQAAGEGGGRGRGGAAVPYWGKYVYHDNNRDINLSQVSMRALVDWYFTAHPPIMHDLHEAQPLLYTYSGGPPQNPNLDPILFAELPFFSNFELAQMTKWGMPGVYTHAFMDGWSPGYLGSVAYNHNGMMRMYETQSGRDLPEPSTSDSTPAGSGASATTSQPAPGAAGRGAGAPPAGAGRGRATGSGQAASTGSGQAASTGSAGRLDRPGRRSMGRPSTGACRWRGSRWSRRARCGCGGRKRRRSAGRRGGPRRRGWRGARPGLWSAHGTRRWPAARAVPRDSDSAWRGESIHAPREHELHGNRCPERAPAHVDVPEPGRRKLLQEDPELD